MALILLEQCHGIGTLEHHRDTAQASSRGLDVESDMTEFDG